MLLEVKKFRQTYVDKSTGETKKSWRYVCYLPSGIYVAIKPVFGNDNMKLNAVIPAEDENATIGTVNADL